jgi:hypothetical protein
LNFLDGFLKNTEISTSGSPAFPCRQTDMVMLSHFLPFIFIKEKHFELQIIMKFTNMMEFPNVGKVI